MTKQQVQQAQPEFYQGEEEDGRVVASGPLQAVQAPGTIALLNKSEIDQQITTARAYPRSITNFRRQSMELVTTNGEVAQQCFYALPRGGKTIEGPSARFAEVMASCWGNNRAAARVVDIGEDYITAQGYFYDLEKNSAVTYEVMRRITNKSGQRFDSDMIGVTGNAACAIAIRNAVLKGIPKALWWDVYLMARKCYAGDTKTLVNRRADAIASFAVFGVNEQQICGLLGVKGRDDINTEHMITLGGIHTAIKEGDTSAEAAFAPENMKTSNGAPARPARSDFKDGGKGGKKKDAPKTDDGKAVEEQTGKKEAPKTEAKTEEKKEPVKAETVEKSTTTESSAKAETPKEEQKPVRYTEDDTLNDYLASKYATLANVTAVKYVDEVQEEVEKELGGSHPDLTADFVAKCNEKARTLMGGKKK